MKMKADLSAEKLREVLNYDQDTGVFTWRKGSARGRVGDVAGGLDSHGYHRICIGRQMWKAHRLAWLYVYGELPPVLVDHIDRNKSNNAIRNLRLADYVQNRANGLAYASNKCGAKGVVWHPQRRRWRAAIRVDGRHISLGMHDTVEEASAAYAEAARRYHGDFPPP